MPTRRKLTERICEQAEATARDVFLNDSEVVGLSLRVLPFGVKSWAFRARIHGRPRRISLGRYVPGSGSLARARNEALKLRAKITDGENPADERIRRRRVEAVGAVTFGELTVRWLEAAKTGRGRGGRLDGHVRKTWEADAATIERSFAGWGERRLDAITADVVRERLDTIAHRSPVSANRSRSLLSTIFRSAMAWKLTAHDPAAEAPRSPERPRERYLDETEAARLLVALDTEPDIRWRCFFGLSLLLGTRRGELLALRWDHVRDLDGQRPAIDLAAETTKIARARSLPLPASATDLLRELAGDPRHGRRASPFVFGSATSATGYRRETRKAWLALCDRAAVKDCHLHDLRRSLASGFAASGEPLSVAQHVLGHTTPAMTAAVYTRVGDDTRRRALDDHAARLSRAKLAHLAKVAALDPGVKRHRA